VVSITTVVVAELILMLVLNLLFLGSLEVHTSQLHPIKGTPVLVPDPKIVISSKLNNLCRR
jgi:hypothetical protein